MVYAQFSVKPQWKGEDKYSQDLNLVNWYSCLSHIVGLQLMYAAECYL